MPKENISPYILFGMPYSFLSTGWLIRDLVGAAILGWKAIAGFCQDVHSAKQHVPNQCRGFPAICTYLVYEQ